MTVAIIGNTRLLVAGVGRLRCELWSHGVWLVESFPLTGCRG
jgi:hypothetical protein